jgi:hypothetical protein
MCYSQMKAIKLVTGVTPTCWRPPYGDVDVSVFIFLTPTRDRHVILSGAGPHSCDRQRAWLANDHMEVRLFRLARRDGQHHLR